MKINDILKEDGDTSGDYQKMLAFAQANRVGGVPDEQQIPLALFKEIQKQRQQNQALSAELSDAEKRINQALGAGELSKKELGMHRGELDRERQAGEKQQATIGQLGQQYTEREKASSNQIKKLNAKLAAIKATPGVDKKTAEDLETQIKQLSKNSISIDKLSQLEKTIASMQSMQEVDDTAIKGLIAQINQAQETSKEIEKSKQNAKQDAGQVAADAMAQLNQIKQQLEHFKEVEKTVAALAKEVNDLETEYDDTTKSLVDLEQDVYRLDTMMAAKTRAGAAVSQIRKSPQAAAQIQQTPAPDPQQIGRSIVDKGVLEPVAESAFNRSIAWATGKTK